MYCVNCGSQTPSGTTFCPCCGQPIAMAAQNQLSAYVPKEKPRLSIGVKLWCIFCMIANLAMYGFGMYFVTTTANLSDSAEVALIVFIVAGMVAAIGFLILLCGRKEGFIIVCAVAAVSILSNLLAVNLPAAILGVANPLITWLIIKGSWHKLNIPGEKLKSHTAALVLAALPWTGFLGVDRFYLGYTWTGLLKLFTCGGCLVWYVMDIIRILNGKMTDKYGRPLRKSGAYAGASMPQPVYPQTNTSANMNASMQKTQPAQKFCSACGNPAVAEAKFCQKCGKALIIASSSVSPVNTSPVQPLKTQPAVTYQPEQSRSATLPQPIQRAQLISAARAIFNNFFSEMVFDPDETLWKEPIQRELDLLRTGGLESIAVLEDLLIQCAVGRGGGISDSWWYGSKWAVKAAAMLPKKEAAELMVRLLQRDSNIMEWFNHVQREAAIQLGEIGSADTLPALQRLLERPFSMSPVSEISRAVEKIGGSVRETPSVILEKAQDRLGDSEGIECLLPFMKQSEAWEKKNQGFYYFLLAHKSQRLGYAMAARAFFAAQIAACPETTSLGWQEFNKDGIATSPENALQLHSKYPVPKTIDEIKSYVATPDTTADAGQKNANAEKPATYTPDEMSASELIDLMTTDNGIKNGLGILGMKLSGKLKAGFYDRPQDVEKALHTFGDASMVARFNMIKDTMKPDDLGLLLPDLLTQYIKRKS